MAALCAARGAAIVADEVFADYELVAGAAAGGGRMLARRDVLVFVLGGLSKSIGLPQAKLGWIAAAGPETAVRAAIARLEVACDAYLSVATPVQIAAPTLLERGAGIRRQIQARIAANYAQLAELARAAPACRLLRAEGGWSAIVRVPTVAPEEELVLDLLTRRGVLTHPGYFFDFPSESYLVASLIVPEADFREGFSRVFQHFERFAAPEQLGTRS
jgi:hypothetical protein